MKHSIIVISEGNYLFGFVPATFDEHYPLNEIWISQDKLNGQTWNFEKKDNSQSGILVNLHQFLNPSHAIFHYNGNIFTKNITGSSDSVFGFFCGQVIAQLTIEEKDKRIVDIESVNKKPANINIASFSEVIKYKRKHVFVIDPVSFFKHHLQD
jgi:hypothetical protein